MNTTTKCTFFVSILFFIAQSYSSSDETVHWLPVIRAGGGLVLVGASVGLECLSHWLRKESVQAREIEKQEEIKRKKLNQTSSYSCYEEEDKSKADEYSITSTLCAVLSKVACAVGSMLFVVGVRSLRSDEIMEIKNSDNKFAQENIMM